MQANQSLLVTSLPPMLCKIQTDEWSSAALCGTNLATTIVDIKKEKKEIKNKINKVTHLSTYSHTYRCQANGKAHKMYNIFSQGALFLFSQFR